MDALLNGGLAIVLAFQSLGSWLTAPMQFFTFLGTEDFYILILPVLYWSVDAALGLRVGLIMLFSTSIYDIAKLTFHMPRPYWYSAKVNPLSAESSFGVPSGHAQNSVTVWGIVGVYFSKKWIWAVSIFIMLGISLSRLYLGVHFPHDTLMGWLFGGIIVWVFAKYWDSVAAWAKKQSFGMQIAYAFSLSMILILLGWIAYARLDGWSMSAEWIENAARAGDELPAPVSMSGLLTATGTLFGMLAGLAFMEKEGGFSSAGTLWQRFARYLVGLVGIAIIYLGLKMIFPAGESLLPSLFRYLRYALLGFWISGLAPWLFVKLQLANNHNN